MNRIRVDCVRKTERSNSWELIRSIGGVSADGRPWKLSLGDAIAGAEGGVWQFYVDGPAGTPVDVVVAVGAHGNKYLKTVADGEAPELLLSLPDCPAVRV